MSTAAATTKVKPGVLILGLAISAVTIFVIAWSASKGWKKGSN